MDSSLRDRISNQIFKFEASIENTLADDAAFTLDFSRGVYRQDELVGLVRDIVPYFALTSSELETIDRSDVYRLAFTRVSDADPKKKGDYGELLLYVILSIFYDAPKFVTKARLRSNTVEQIKGFDCAHFTLEGEIVTLWLGEAKFHQKFSGALSSAFTSLQDHIDEEVRVKRELKILGGNIEINKTLDPDLYKAIKSYVNGGKSIDKIPIRVPVLLTYDSKHITLCNGVQSSSIDSQEFKDELTKELAEKFKSIYGKKWPDFSNIKFVFFVMPLYSVADMKKKLEFMEQGMKF